MQVPEFFGPIDIVSFVIPVIAPKALIVGGFIGDVRGAPAIGIVYAARLGIIESYGIAYIVVGLVRLA